LGSAKVEGLLARLRRDLDSYYVDAGHNDGIRILIPKGSYVPYFERHNARPLTDSIDQQVPDIRDHSTNGGTINYNSGSKPTFFRSLLIIAAIATTLAAGVAGWMLHSGRAQTGLGSLREPALVVMPFEALSSGEDARYLALGIGQELISNLFRFTGFRFYTSATRSDQELSSSPVEFASKLGVAYVVNGSVRASAEEIGVTTQVLNATSGEVIWTKTYARPFDPQALMAIQRDLAGEIATAIGQPYGVVKNHMSGNPMPAAAPNMQSYQCVLRAYGYRRSFLRKDFDPVLRCLEQTVQRDPEYSDGWAMLGWLHVDAARLGYTGESNRQQEYEKALQATSRAVMLQPDNPLALKALAAAYHYVGRYSESERVARQATDLNPNDPDSLAQLGWRLAVRGNFKEGIPMLKRAIDRTWNPPSWYFHLIAIDLYLKGDYEQMLTFAERSRLGDSGFSQLLLAVGNGELGNREAAQRALEKMSQYQPLARDPAGFLRRHGATDQIVDALTGGLQKARSIASK
jgi:TolB-like protein